MGTEPKVESESLADCLRAVHRDLERLKEIKAENSRLVAEIERRSRWLRSQVSGVKYVSFYAPDPDRGIALKVARIRGSDMGFEWIHFESVIPIEDFRADANEDEPEPAHEASESSLAFTDYEDGNPFSSERQIDAPNH